MVINIFAFCLLSQSLRKISGKWANIPLFVSSVGWNFFPGTIIPLSTVKAQPTTMRVSFHGCRSRLPTTADRVGYTSLTPRDDGDICLVRACGLRTSDPEISDIDLDELVPKAPRETSPFGVCPSQSLSDRAVADIKLCMVIDSIPTNLPRTASSHPTLSYQNNVRSRCRA